MAVPMSPSTTLVDSPSLSPSTASSSPHSGKVDGAPSAAGPQDDMVLASPLYEGEGTAASPYVVKFLPNDNADPMQWTELKKWLITANVAFSTLCVSFGSSVYSGGLMPIMMHFNISSEVCTLGLTLYVLGFAFGPLIWAPASELEGRRLIFACTFGPFALFHIGCATAQNIETLLICRFFAGFFGSSPLTNAGGVITDMFPASNRAMALSVFALCPFLGPAVGPAVGGFIGQFGDSWRLLFWVMFAFSGSMYLIGLLVPETYAPKLLRQRAQALSKQTGGHYISMLDLHLDPNATYLNKVKGNLTQPFILLFTEITVFLFSLYAALIYGVLFLLFGGVPLTFQVARGWGSGVGSLPFLSVGVGMIAGVLVYIWVNKKYARDLEAHGGVPLEPEARLPITKLAAIVLPVGMFWFAWTVQPSVHFILPILALAPFGFGMVLIFLGTMNYLVDMYLRVAASALAANALLRSLFGACFPLFTRQMFEALGNNWALTLVAFLALAMTPIPFVFHRYGPHIRAKSKFSMEHPAITAAKARAAAAAVGEQKV